MKECDEGPRPPKLRGPSPKIRDGVTSPRFDKAIRTWQAAIEEIISSEKKYLSSLCRLVSEVQRPLELRAGTPEIGGTTLEELHCLFGNVEELIPLHRNIVKQIEQEQRDVADVLIATNPLFDVYATYVRNYPRASRLIEILDGRSKLWEFVCKCLGEESSFLPSFLIQPIQKIPRYALLLEELCKAKSVIVAECNSGGGDEEEESLLREALSAIKSTAMRLNVEADLANKLLESEEFDMDDDDCSPCESPSTPTDSRGPAPTPEPPSQSPIRQ